jgi:hypothetical protein
MIRGFNSQHVFTIRNHNIYIRNTGLTITLFTVSVLVGNPMHLALPKFVSGGAIVDDP